MTFVALFNTLHNKKRRHLPRGGRRDDTLNRGLSKGWKVQSRLKNKKNLKKLTGIRINVGAKAEVESCLNMSSLPKEGKRHRNGNLKAKIQELQLKEGRRSHEDFECGYSQERHETKHYFWCFFSLFFLNTLFTQLLLMQSQGLTSYYERLRGYNFNRARTSVHQQTFQNTNKLFRVSVER